MSSQDSLFIAHKIINQANDHNGSLLGPVGNPGGHGGSAHMGFGTGHYATPFATPMSYSEALKQSLIHPRGHKASHQTTPNLGYHTPPTWAPNTESEVVTGGGGDASSDDQDELDWTPSVKERSVRVFEASMRLDTATPVPKNKGKAVRVSSITSNESDEVPMETPIKGKGPMVEVNVMGSYKVKLSFLMYTEKGVNPLKMSTQKLKNGVGKWIPYRIDPTSTIIEIVNDSFADLKEILFTVSDTLDQDAPPGGNSSIFTLADTSGTVTVNAYIDRHDVFSKSKGYKLVNDHDVQEFFTAVQLSPLKEAGLTISMADPAKSAKAADTKIAMAQSRLKAMSAMNNVTVTSTQLTESIPLDPLQVQLESLIKKYGSLNNHSREGWRVYKPHEASKYMQMNYEHLHKWAQELADSKVGVDLENPPMYLDGFKWTDVKRPLSTAAPPPLAKKNKVSDLDTSDVSTPGGYSECQGYHIHIHRGELEEVKKYSTLEDFLDYAGIPPFFVSELGDILADHHIDSFEQFLFPELMDIRDVLKLGISWGMAMKLFSQSRLFYQQIKKEISTFKRVTAHEGPYKTRNATPFDKLTQSTQAEPVAGPSRLPDTAPVAGTSRSSGF